MTYGFGSTGTVSSGGGGHGVTAAPGYGYSTITSSTDANLDSRTHRSNTISGLSKGYSMFINARPRIDRRYSPPPASGVSRYRAVTGSSGSGRTSPHAGTLANRSIFSKLSPPPSEPRQSTDSPHKTTSQASRRKSNNRHRSATYSDKKAGTRKTSMGKDADKKSGYRLSFSSIRSRATAGSVRSKGSGRNKKKAKGGYGLWGCFGG